MVNGIQSGSGHASHPGIVGERVSGARPLPEHNEKAFDEEREAVSRVFLEWIVGAEKMFTEDTINDSRQENNKW